MASSVGSVLDFFATGAVSASALRFLGATAGVSSSSPSSLSSSDDEPSDVPEDVASLPDSSSETYAV